MTNTLSIDDAVEALRTGAVIVYPTEAVWGLGCDPFSEPAVTHLLAIKERAPEKGLILIGSDLEQFDGIVDWWELSDMQRNAVTAHWPGPYTWLVPATARVPAWISGVYDTVAIRVSAHPVVVELCRAYGGPIVSTSANRSGEPAAFRCEQLDPTVIAQAYGVCEGETSGLTAPSMIRDARSGATLRM